MLLELRPLRPLGVRGERVQVRRLRARPLAVRRQEGMFRPGDAVHALGLAFGSGASLRLLLRHPAHRGRHRHLHPPQRNTHRQGIYIIYIRNPRGGNPKRRSLLAGSRPNGVAAKPAQVPFTSIDVMHARYIGGRALAQP